MIIAEVIFGENQRLLSFRQTQVGILFDMHLAIRSGRLHAEIIQRDQHIAGIIKVLYHGVEFRGSCHGSIVLSYPVLADDICFKGTVVVDQGMKENVRYCSHVNRNTLLFF